MIRHFEKIWRTREADPLLVETLGRTQGLSELTARLLVSRGIHEPEAVELFLNPSLDKLRDPFLLKGMHAAVDRIREAVANREPICIYGDYDVDGITAISLLYRFFAWWGYPVTYYIPDRLEEGYGISEAGVRRVRELGCGLMISVDCGITSVDRVLQARELGMDVIITDHHEPQAVIPDAVAVINPKQPECPYPEKTLSGVGIALKLAQALEPRWLTDAVAPTLLQIAALGTVADIVPLTGENRIIVKNGIEALRHFPATGCLALMQAAGTDPQKVGTGQIGFQLAPRINAAGRIDAPQKGVELLVTEEAELAAALAEELSQLNEERQQLERRIFEEALAQASHQVAEGLPRVLVIAGRGWHPGVIGIVASRMVERFYRPCILLNCEGGTAKGSARSIEGFNLFEALCTAGDLMQKFGGHEMAAGMTLPEANIEALRRALNAYAQTALTEYDLIPRIHAECVLEARQLQFALLEELERLEPFGPGNPKPVFLYRGLTVDQRRLLGKNQEHVKLLAHDGSRVFEAIGFRWPDPARFAPGQRVDLAFVVERNTFNGVESLQLQLRDARIRQWRNHRAETAFRSYWAAFWPGCLSLDRLLGITESGPWPVVPPSALDLGQRSPENRVRLLLWSPEALEALLAEQQDTAPAARLPLHFGRCPANLPAAALIQPDLEVLGREGAEALLLWEPPPLPSVYRWGESCCKMNGILYNESVGDGMTAILDQLIPSKEALAETYRRVRSAGEYQWSRAAYSTAETEPVLHLQEEVRLWILAQNGLIQASHKGEAVIWQVSPYSGERLNIVESEPYHRLLKLKALITHSIHAQHAQLKSGGIL